MTGPAADGAHFLGTDAGKSKREEEKHSLTIAEIITQLDVGQTVRVF